MDKKQIEKPICVPNSVVDINAQDEEYSELKYIVEELNDVLDSNLMLSDDIFVTDQKGQVIFIKKITNALNPGFIKQGVCLSLKSTGCNGIGLALQELTPTKCEGEEHYQSILHDKVSFGFPIIKGNHLLGCVGFITSMKTSTLHIDIMKNIVETAMNAISRMLEARQRVDELYLLKDFLEELDNNKGMIMIDADFTIIQVNREAELILGINKDELISKSFKDFCNSISVLPGSDSQKRHYEQLVFNTVQGRVKVDAIIFSSILPNARILGWGIQFTPVNMTNKFPVTKPVKYKFRDIIGRNREFLRLLTLAKAIANSPSNVLITGASGTGKELFAQAIHYASYCSGGPFIAINCAAIPGELMEAELFGYVEGAFTGAKKGGSKGKFIKANGGTLFLDEIGDMPLELQPKLLRVLQDRVITPVGGYEPIPVNIRVISATNQNIGKMVVDKKFRADLYYRLNVVNLRIPPLSKRKDDIPLLVEHFLNIYNYKLKKHITTISPQALECLVDYEWPGNVRELENVIEMAVNLADDVIDLEHIEPNLFDENDDGPAFSGKLDFIVPLEEVEKKQIVKALEVFNGNVANAARALEIGRTTLYRKVKKYDLLNLIK